jgi:BlaI family penicillinase repressor
MRILWREGRVTARQITEKLNREAPEAPIAHSTTQTLLRKLEARGAVAHETEGRVFVFKPLYRESEVALSAARDLLNRVFDGSVSGLVAHLLSHEQITADERRELRRLLQEELNDE